MAWLTLIASGVMESVWAVALSKSGGFSRPLPTIVFLIALALSMIGLAHASKTLPMGTAYAVWTVIGASLTVVYGMVTGADPFSVARVALIAGLVGCIIGLKLVGNGA